MTSLLKGERGTMVLTCKNCGNERLGGFKGADFRCPACGSDRIVARPCVEGPKGVEGSAGAKEEDLRGSQHS